MHSCTLGSSWTWLCDVLVAKSTSKHWPCLFPQHGPGRKHTRKIELEQWQVIFVQKTLVNLPEDYSIQMAGVA